MPDDGQDGVELVKAALTKATPPPPEEYDVTAVVAWVLGRGEPRPTSTARTGRDRNSLLRSRPMRGA